MRDMRTTANYSGRAIGPRLTVAVLLTGLLGCSGGPGRLGVYQPGAIESQLMAEVALQRGEYRIAAQEYVRVAQRSDDPDSAQRATEFAYDYGLDAYALTAAERWVRLEPESRLAHGYLGRLYVRRNALDRAFTSLDIALGPAEDRLEFEYAGLAADLAEHAPASRAQQIFARFAQQSPANPGVLRAWASLAAQAGDLDTAVELARQTSALAPAWQPARIMLANLLLAAGDKSSAFEQMAFAVEANPGLDMELEFIRLLNQADETDEALERLARLDIRFPSDPDLIRVRARTYMIGDEFDLAIDDYLYLLDNGFFIDESLWELGRMAFDQEDYGAAAGYFQRIHTGAWQLPARLARATAYQQMGDSVAALGTLDSYVERYPQQRVDTLSTRAQLLLDAGKPDEALETLDLALEYRPWSVGFWLEKGNLLEQMEQYRKAIAAFRRAYEFAPEEPLTLNALGYTLANRTRKYAEAETYIARALEKEPDSPAIIDSMGWVLLKQKEYSAAQKYLERAHKLMDDPEIAAHLGEVLWRQKDRDAAREIWADALEKFPESEVLTETMRRLDQ